MKNRRPQFLPERKDLLVLQLSDEVILYDRGTSKAHLLNRTSAEVWKRCDGRKSATEIARALEHDLAWPVDEGLVWIALRQLNESGLLQNEIPPAIGKGMLSRRELVRQMGIGAAIALPIATSILVPTPAAAQSPARPRRAPSRR